MLCLLSSGLINVILSSCAYHTENKFTTIYPKLLKHGPLDLAQHHWH